MSATQIDLKWSAVVEDYDRLPSWLRALVEETGKSCDELVRAMIEAEMETAGLAFLKKHPELFRYPENGLT